MKAWGRPESTLRRAEVADCDVLSDIHAATFRRGWSGAEFEALLVQRGVHALIAQYRNTFGWRTPAGFLLYRIVADEGEILSVAVVHECRRRGIARQLLEEALRHAYRDGARTIHLEVEDSNLAAIRLYRAMEFRESGKRPGYYGQGRATPGGAVTMVRQLRQAASSGEGL
jgi:ribosomal-protein-alanine N-acetyltransferase